MARVCNADRLIVSSPQRHADRVIVAQALDVVAELVETLRTHRDDFADKKPGHVEVVNGLVSENSSRNRKVIDTRRCGVSANDQQLLERTHVPSANATVNLGKVRVKPTVKSQSNGCGACICFIPQSIHSGDIKVDGLFAQHRHPGVDCSVNQIDVGRRGGSDNHRVDRTRVKELFGVLRRPRAKLVGKRTRPLEKNISDSNQRCIREARDAARMNLTNAPRTNDANSQ